MSDYKAHIAGQRQFVATAVSIVQYPDARIELLMNFPCNSKSELLKQEGDTIKQYKNQCVNYRVAGRTKQEYKIDNKEHIKVANKLYNDLHKEKYKQYREEHKAEIKAKRGVKVDCQCGGHYTLNHKARHERTELHQNHLAQ